MSIVIPVHNALEYLEKCIASIREHTADGTYELIIVDDASDSPVPEYLETLQPWASVITNWPNEGFSRSCNTGARAARGEFLLFLNSDIEVSAGWLEGFVEAIRREADAAAVGCKLLYPDGAIQHGGIFTLEDQLNGNPFTASQNHVGFPSNHPPANVPQMMRAVTAAAMLVRTTAFWKVGGFDDEYYNGFEDVDLCLKLWSIGYGVFYEPRVALVHHESRSGDKRSAKMTENVKRLADSWRGRVQPDAIVSPYCQVVPHPGIQHCTDHVATTQVVIVTHNSMQTISPTLDAVREFLGVYDELLIVDDASTDGTSRFLSLCEHKDSRIQVQYRKEHMGEAYRRAEVLELSATETIAWIEPGVQVTQGWLPRMRVHHRSVGVGCVVPTMDREGDQSIAGLIPNVEAWPTLDNERTHQLGQSYAGRSTPIEQAFGGCVLIGRGLAQEMVRSFGHGIAGTDGMLLSWAMRALGLQMLLANDVYVGRHLNGRLDTDVAAAAKAIAYLEDMGFQPDPFLQAQGLELLSGRT